MVALECSDVILDPTRESSLQAPHRQGPMVPAWWAKAGEHVDAICIRDVLEATGFKVRIVWLLGVYSCPHRLEASTDGKRDHMVGLNVEAEAIGGTFPLSDETTVVGYFSWDDVTRMDVMETSVERFGDVSFGPPAPFVR